jgi:hypothetical protein
VGFRGGRQNHPVSKTLGSKALGNMTLGKQKKPGLIARAFVKHVEAIDQAAGL